MKVVVTGASGFVGSFLCEHLAERGHRVRAVVRKTSNLRWLESTKVSTACSDICDVGSLIPIVSGADIVYHAAGLVRADRRRDFMRVNYEGTCNVAQACLDAPERPGRLVFVSSQAAAGSSPGPDGIDEDYPSRPVSAYGESKLAAERYLAGLRDLDAVIVRPAAVYGPRDTESLSFFKMPAKLRILPMLGGGRTTLSLIEVRDLVRAITLAGETPRARGRTYFLAGRRPCTIDELLGEVAHALKKRCVRLPVCGLALSAAAELSEFLAQFGTGRARLSHLKVPELLQRYWVVKTGRARQELGFEANTPLADGIRSTARWYIENGWL